MHKFLVNLLMVALLLLPFSQAAAATNPELTAQAAILLDLHNQQVLLEKNPDARMYPASTTKMVTAMLAIQRGQLDDMVMVSPGATQVEGSVIGLREGEEISLEDLLYALLLPSANDAALAIAEHIGGTVEDFVAMMNAEAGKIGATSTNFVNPHGLSHPDHYTTARDLAKIALWATKNPIFRVIVATPYYQATRPGPDKAGGELPLEDFESTNRLLWANTPYALAGTTGIKTGYTSLAGRCLVFSVQRDGRELLGVLLNSPGFEVYQDARALAEHGFNNFKPVELARAGEEIARAEVKGGAKKEVGAVALDTCTYNIPPGQNPHLEREIKWQDKIIAPVEQGNKLGEALWYLDGQVVGQVDLVAAETVPKKFPYWLLVLIALVATIMRREKLNRRRASNRN